MLIEASQRRKAILELSREKKNSEPYHKTRMTSRVVNGTAADDPLYHRIRLSKKKIAKMKPGTRKEVIRTFDFHFSPPNIL